MSIFVDDFNIYVFILLPLSTVHCLFRYQMLIRFGFLSTLVLLIPVQLPRKLPLFETLEKQILCFTQACKENRIGIQFTHNVIVSMLHFMSFHQKLSLSSEVWNFVFKPSRSVTYASLSVTKEHFLYVPSVTEAQSGTEIHLYIR